MSTAMTGRDAVPPPDWFTAAIDAPVASDGIVVDGARICYRAWGDPRDPGVVLVHGSAANARWWDHIAPQLADGRHVVAIDLSGHGDSQWRASYQQAVWAGELRAVVRDAMQPNPVVVAHSMGGKVAYRAALQGMDREIAGLVLLDSNIAHQMRPERAARQRIRARRPRRVYRDVETIVQAFRPAGTRGVPLPRFFAQHVGFHSAESVSGGWSWKFDPAVAAASTDVIPELGRLACPGWLFAAATGSVLDESAVAKISDQMGDTIAIGVLPRSGHHMMFDAPSELVAALRKVLMR